MSQLPVFREGGYRFIQAVFQYSGGVAAGQRDGERYGFFWGGKL